MKFLIYKEEIINILKKINNITYIDYINEDKNILIINKNNYLIFIGNNLEIEINIKTNNYITKKEGKIFISYKKILNICKLLKKDIYIKFYVKKKYLLIKNDKSIFFILSKSINLNKEEFLLENKKIELLLYSNNLIYLIKDTYFSISNNDIRLSFNNMLIKFLNNNIYSITTDGFRLSISKFILNSYLNLNIEIMIHKKSVIEILKFLNNLINKNILLVIYENFLLIKSDNENIIVRIIKDKFPDYYNVINKKNKFKIKILKEEIKNSILRISSILEINNYLICLHIFNNKLKISSINRNNEKSIEKIYIENINVNVKIYINFTYILEVLNTLYSEYIFIEFNNSTSSIEIKEENNYNKKYIIMPIKI